MSPDLTGCFKKIDRSLEHLDALNESAERFFNDDLYGIYRLHGETNTQRTKCLFRAELLRPLPVLEWGIIVGDAVHCLRSALDQLAYALSLNPDGNTAFPIFGSKKDWVTKGPAMMWGIPEPLIAAIDNTQPYHRGDAAHGHPLAVLRTLSNCDKHKFIPVTALVPDSGEWHITQTQGIASYGSVLLKTGRPLEHRAILAELPVVPDKSGLEPQVQMHGGITFSVGFGQSGIPPAVAGKPVIPAFGDIGRHVQGVLIGIGEAAKKFIDASEA